MYYHCNHRRKNTKFINESSSPIYLLSKRILDIIISIVMLSIFFIPILLIVIFFNKILPGNRCPIFFKQRRSGQNCKTFSIIKFCSMKRNVNANRIQAFENDPRITKFGNFLRKYSLDEIPQFFNVLAGNMSIVGPRPHMLRHTIEYSEKIPNYLQRLSVKPGITGFAQITGYRGETKHLEQMVGRIERDLWYIQHRNFLLDCKIILLTPLALSPIKNKIKTILLNNL